MKKPENHPDKMQKTKTTPNMPIILPDGSSFFIATVMSKEEAFKLPPKDRPICYRISSEMYTSVFEAIGAASMCWKPRPGEEVFSSEEASQIAVDLCFKIAEELEKPNADPSPHPAPVENERDGNWIDKWGSCKVCGGEIPYGHTNNCDIYKLEQEIGRLKTPTASESVEVREAIGELQCWADAHKDAAFSPYIYLVCRVLTQSLTDLARINTYRCKDCNGELSQCGEQDADGEPTLDCLVCKLRADLARVQRERDTLAAQFQNLRNLASELDPSITDYSCGIVKSRNTHAQLERIVFAVLSKPSLTLLTHDLAVRQDERRKALEEAAKRSQQSLADLAKLKEENEQLKSTLRTKPLITFDALDRAEEN